MTKIEELNSKIQSEVEYLKEYGQCVVNEIISGQTKVC